MLSLAKLIPMLISLINRVMEQVNAQRLMKAGRDDYALQQVEEARARRDKAKAALDEVLSEARKDYLDEKYGVRS